MQNGWGEEGLASSSWRVAVLAHVNITQEGTRHLQNNSAHHQCAHLPGHSLMAAHVLQHVEGGQRALVSGTMWLPLPTGAPDGCACSNCDTWAHSAWAVTAP